MNSLFTQIIGNKPKKNAFDLSHERKFSMNMGELVPILCEDVIPGDTWRLNTEVLIRFAPMLAPVMHRINVYTHFFFVPNRLIWDEWELFITGGRTGDEPQPEFPHLIVNDGYGAKVGHGSLADYLGTATTDGAPSGSAQISALPFRAYQLIYNEYYRDQNLEEPNEFFKGSGAVDWFDDDIGDMQQRAWEKDYFTSALPWTQRGGDVHLPINGHAPVFLKDELGQEQIVVQQNLDPAPVQVQLAARANEGTLVSNSSPGSEYLLDPAGTMEADLSEATGTTIEELRKATKLQQWLERNARGGARYIEQILSHFGVQSSDARLQRPEYLGGGKTPVSISEVLQTSATNSDVQNADTPLGEMGGHALASGNSHRFKKFFEEHGYIIGIISVLPKTAYMQGTRKHFLKNDKFDFYFPEFAQLGEQPVEIRELYDDFGTNVPKTFGYQSRYAEYKYIPSTTHGDFKKDGLMHWHMAIDYDDEPVLNNDFVKSDPTTRIFAVTEEEPSDEQKLWVQVYNNIKALRPIPKFNNPSLL